MKRYVNTSDDEAWIKCCDTPLQTAEFQSNLNNQITSITRRRWEARLIAALKVTRTRKQFASDRKLFDDLFEIEFPTNKWNYAAFTWLLIFIFDWLTFHSRSSDT